MNNSGEEEFIRNSYAFFDGMQINDLIPNTTACFSDFTNISFVYNKNIISYIGNPVNSPYNKTIKVAKYISYWSMALQHCTSVVLNVYTYGIH